MISTINFRSYFDKNYHSHSIKQIKRSHLNISFSKNTIKPNGELFVQCAAEATWMAQAVLPSAQFSFLPSLFLGRVQCTDFK